MMSLDEEFNEKLQQANNLYKELDKKIKELLMLQDLKRFNIKKKYYCMGIIPENVEQGSPKRWFIENNNGYKTVLYFSSIDDVIEDLRRLKEMK